MTSEYSVGLGNSPSSRLQFYNGSTCISLKPVDTSKPVIIKNSKAAVAEAVITSKKDGYYEYTSEKTPSDVSRLWDESPFCTCRI